MQQRRGGLDQVAHPNIPATSPPPYPSLLLITPTHRHCLWPARMTPWKVSSRAACSLTNSCWVNVCWNQRLNCFVWQLLLITVRPYKLNLALLDRGICIGNNKNRNDTENSIIHMGEQLWIVPWHLKCGKCHHLWDFRFAPHTCSCARVSRSEDAPIQATLHSKAATVHHSRRQDLKL